MPDVYLGLGSNLQPKRHLELAVSQLAARFDLRAVSSVYRNAPVGFDGEDFLNAVACVRTDQSAEQLVAELEAIHDLAGRQRGADAFVSRTLDIDLLLYGDEVIEAQHQHLSGLCGTLDRKLTEEISMLDSKQSKKIEETDKRLSDTTVHLGEKMQNDHASLADAIALLEQTNIQQCAEIDAKFSEKASAHDGRMEELTERVLRWCS